MKIKENDGTLIDVYAIYWIEGKTYFYGLVKEYGLSAFSADEVTIIDSEISGDFVFFEDGVFFKPLITEKILDDLVEGDLETYCRFIEILKATDKIDSDSY
ncbi:hypothetical protein HZS38_02480 [Xenorhabdus nematophila]|uniref:hypothetical protein n=2 Tax=Xenorhabdus nematophila TaxID=628 RepID=UPI00054430EF|nr:hypothetical protein [Xenorhabdus nematophila]CEF31666.1 conserved hypothetical protein [Xenorhabdus nematophila str. Websteri]AYA39546.1 hypothetical protein D3790_02840 [Xenorhabdus nematophila]MBA0018110.1 hypothetical protein [Xenorhabdus nematophila]MCB4426217.1 hypothetical protein [Xenorhabdus nematophila]QNJ37197.1 hypothetical protein H8F46_02795 [Xenorhabdus nematophila]